MTRKNYRDSKGRIVKDKTWAMNGYRVTVPDELQDYVKLVGLSTHYLYDILNYYTKGQYPDDI